MISIRLRRLYRRLLYRTSFLRCFRPGIHARIPLPFKASLNQSASCPRSPRSQSTSGRLLYRAFAPVCSLTCPAVTNRFSGRPWLSKISCSLVFIPPLVRPISRPPPFFDPETGDRAVCFQVSCVDHHGLFLAVISSQTDHHLDKDTFVAPPPPTIVQGLVWAVVFRRITPAHAIAIDGDNPVLDAPSACPSAKKEQAYHNSL